ncbi:ABC transporter permease [Corynebacterium propinquum]|uniref:ABC transporter permease n=1 Tax=Corynebacterium propinquum TaxID=43769 RepID=UPI00266ECD73|nr:ABC transporter permease [Corynebacterium propinquum]WKS31892.1 ABC transporter permease [Corynebacterium propinquum]WKS36183.1 ABC transporter permease [Corynebacterium propinquum]WKS38354.1 ABC transporter permease [Corynebacterium propinquum]WKS42594.1 ABC transporter permease [Corynebacterium propinquum]WKS46891.1 ABC transporter permease [Corynebacterium propinquum]
MFLALRDIVSARGRFSLISFVVGLITVLLVMLTGLTGGLAKHNTSALEALAPERYVFTSEEPSFQESQVTTSDVQEWQELVDAGIQVIPLGTAQTRLEAGSAMGVAVLGLPAGTTVPAPVVSGAGAVGTEIAGATAVGAAREAEAGADSAVSLEPQEPQEAVVAEDGIVLSRDIVAEAGVQPGDTVEIGGVEQPVSAVVEDEYYSHQPVVWASTQVWQQIARAHDDVVGTVLAVNTQDRQAGALSDDEWSDAENQTGHSVATVEDSFSGLAAYQSEQASLQLIQVLLYAISALVTVAFLSVWTIQRSRDLSVLRALGASPGYVWKDALGQAAVVVGIGVVLGAGVGLAAGVWAGSSVPFDLQWTTVVVPAAGIWVLGMCGALVATRRVKKIDPASALEGKS